MNDRELDGKFARYERIKDYLEYESTILADEMIKNRLAIKRSMGEKINILFICHRPTVWNSQKTVYQAFIKDSEFNVKILAIPNKKQLPVLGAGHDFFESEGAEEFWEGINCVNGYDYEKGEWLDPRTLNPDYVFYQQPYNICLPRLYKSWIISKYARICYLSYGYQIAGGDIFESVYPQDFMKNVKYLFTSDQYDTSDIKKWFKINNNDFTNIVMSGNPRFDLYKTEGTVPNNNFTALWTPRWCTSENNCFFFDFKDLLLDYCDKNKDFNLIFRPHPQAFLEWNATGELPEEEANQYKSQYDIRGNASIDNTKDYLQTFKKVDCFITDMTSLMAEYLYTGKPVIYCHKTDCFTRAGIEISKGFYWVHDYIELEKTLNMLKDGKDPLKNTRYNIINNLFYKPEGGAGNNIKNYLKNDAIRGEYNGSI